MASCSMACGDAVPDVDQLGALARISEEPRGNEVIVDDNVGSTEMVEAVDGDEARIAGASRQSDRPPDVSRLQTFNGCVRALACRRGSQRRPGASRSSATALPTACGFAHRSARFCAKHLRAVQRQHDRHQRECASRYVGVRADRHLAAASQARSRPSARRRARRGTV